MTKVEDVARVISVLNPRCDGTLCAYLLSGNCECGIAARAAVLAMRVPSEAMVKAGAIYWDPADGSPIKMAFNPTEPYGRMIDAALSEDKP